MSCSHPIDHQGEVLAHGQTVRCWFPGEDERNDFHFCPDRAEGPSHKATLTYCLLPVAENSAVLGDPVQLSSF